MRVFRYVDHNMGMFLSGEGWMWIPSCVQSREYDFKMLKLRG